jgi:Thymidylate kinase
VENLRSSGSDAHISNGLIVKFDGVDGCGKSALCQSVRTRLTGQLNVFVTAQFGSSDDIIADSTAGNQSVSQTVRDFALNPRYECDDIERQLLLNVISRRADRIAIARNAKSHDLILVDRSFLSNLAYGLPLDPISPCWSTVASAFPWCQIARCPGPKGSRSRSILFLSRHHFGSWAYFGR